MEDRGRIEGAGCSFSCQDIQGLQGQMGIPCVLYAKKNQNKKRGAGCRRVIRAIMA